MNTTARALILFASPGLIAHPAIAQFCNFDDPVVYQLTAPGGGGTSPNFIAAGDIDGDGNIDLIADSNGPGNDPTTILWNDGSGNFSQGVSLTSGWGFGGVALGDMDGDGDLDVLRCNYFSNGVYFFRNNGDRTFEAGIFYSGGGGCVSVEFVDIDGDGDLDFVTVDKFGGKIRPYRNINALGFTSVGLFDCNPHPYGMDTGDVDHDGDMDIIVGNEESNTVTIVYNAGDGTFPTRQAFTVGERPVDVILEDLDSDGNLDAVATDWDALIGLGNTVSVLMGDGSGGFATRQTYTTGVSPSSVQSADLDGDGVLDLIVACQVGDVLSLLKGNGDGTFDPAQTIDNGSNPQAVALADFDSDGATDIAYIDNTFSRLYTLRNTCDTPADPPTLGVNWQTGYDNFFNVDNGTHVVVNNSGEIIVAGTTTFNENEEDFLVAKFDTQGNLLWDAVYNGDGDHYDTPAFLGLDAEGNIFVAGPSWGPSFSVQWAVVKYDTAGNLLWARRYDGGNPIAQQQPRGYAIGPNGEFAMTGWARDASFNNVLFDVVCYGADGDELWRTHFPQNFSGNPGAQGEAVAFDASGNVIATGITDDDDEFGTEMITVKIDPSGTVLWEDIRDLTDDTQLNETRGRAVTTDAAGNIFVGATATIDGFSDSDALMLIYAPDGTLIDTVSDPQPGNAYPSLFTWVASDQLLLSGSGGSFYRATSFDPAGSVNWSANIDASASSANKYGHVALGDDGYLYFIDSDGGDIAVEQWSTDGQFQSRTRFDSGAAFEYPSAIAAGASGHLYVVGVYQPSILNRNDVLLYDLVSDTGAVCLPDLNDDGNLDFFDVSTFINAYGSGDPAADLDDNGELNFFDVSAFLNAFSTGCP